MGSICSRDLEEDDDIHRIKSVNHFVSIAAKQEVVAAIADVSINSNHRGAPIFMLKTQENAVPVTRQSSKEGEKKAPAVIEMPKKVVEQQKRATRDAGVHKDDLEVVSVPNDPEAIIRVPNGSAREHIAAGWPSWLVSVAGEAIKGWLPRKADSFEKLEKIGQGTYSSVYRARDLQTEKIVALKKVRFVNMDPESVRFMAREIHILRRLDHQNVIKLEGIITSRMSSNLYLVFEYMEHDLAGIAARPGVKFTEPEVKCYMRQILEGLAHCHSRGVLHRDIKGSNILVDNNGNLRIADFGLASFFDPDQKQQLTSRVVTLWYRPPELLLGATEYGAAVDLWSSGCILAELLAGKPIMPGRTEVEQMHKIFKLCGSPSDEYWQKSKLPHATSFRPQRRYRRRITEAFCDFPDSALSLLDKLLAIEPEKRGTAVSALESKFFTTEPFACDPSSLPKYPSSKEYDAKLREEARRQGAEASHGQGSETVRPERKGSKKMQATNAKMEMQKQRNSQKFNAQNSASRLAIDPPEIGAQNSFRQSTMHPTATVWNNKMNHGDMMVPGRAYSVRVPNEPQLKTQRSFLANSGRTEFSNFPSSVSRGSTKNLRYSGLNITELTEKQDEAYSTYKKNEITRNKDSTVAYNNRNKRIQYSGPLVPPGGSIEDLLKEHDRQIQEAARKARINKVKNKKNY